MSDTGPVDRQARAQSLDTRTSFLVQAPAGSGKTELLTRRLLKLLAEVDEPEHILAITFTIAATAEMRARVLKNLHDADKPGSDGAAKDLNDLARAAMANSVKRGWDILQQPQRLNIQTIDAVCLTIAHQTPLLSRLGGSLSPTDKPQPLYDLAARRTLARLGEKLEISDALSALLQLRSASLTACQKLIAEMLGNRDQWGRVLGFRDPGESWPEVRAKLEEPLQRLHTETVEKAQLCFAAHPTIEPKLMYLLAYACSNPDINADLMLLDEVKQLSDLTTTKHWLCLCDLLMTDKDGWRVRPNKNQGFAGGTKGKPAKDRFAALVAEMDGFPELQAVLCEVRDLPPAAYSDEESEMLRHLLVILRYAVAELRLVFAEQEVVDFVELGLAAMEVLQDEQGRASELAADVAGRWSHVLVDEFQDTSRSQYKLLTLLAEGWESAGPATCFLVGDPMQSIYMFRQAEVELFERTRKYGLGEGTARVDLTPLQLQTNFRSHTELVNRLNQIFKQVFARSAEEDDQDYHVAFVPSTADARNVECEPGVYVWPRLLASKATPEECAAALDDESRDVVRIINEALPRQKKQLAAGKNFRIAVLVRAKSHLERIAKRLRAAGIRFRAVEIEPLGQRQEVRDLAALTRALLHPMHRIAWLTVLRAPWCGLTLADLHILCGSDDKAFASQPVITLLRERIHLLSSDGQVRARRVHTVLEHALRGAHRQVSLSRWVERTWASLGGNACVSREGYENVRAFFNMLDKLGLDAGGLEAQLDALCAQPDPFADERWGVQLMTIHKAKGLGFEVVIVPGMERRTKGESASMVRWIEETRLVGASEEVEQMFVVAPIGRSGPSSGIYGWIGKQQVKRQDDETKRLLYVAATRACETLHLLGTATVRAHPDDKGPLTLGDKHSLLGIAWEALRPEFERALRERPDVVAEQTVMAFPEPVSMIPLRRLPSAWRPRIVDEPVSHVTLEDTEKWERPRGSLASRAFGTVVHGLLEDVSNLAAVDGDWQSAIREVGSWRERAFAMLRAGGQPREDAAQNAGRVVQVLLGVLNDPVGRWIVGARTRAETEASWSSWSSEGVQTLRGDRMFWAGPEPGSLGDSHLWIVDYKTGRAGGQSVDAWLEEEKRKYLPQLEAYAEVMRKVHGAETPIRMALYFPSLQRLIWWG